MEWIRGEVIGRGSFSVVNLATLTKSNTNRNPNQTSIAVKSSHVSNSSSLKNEKEILIELGNYHPNIMRCFGDSVSNENGTQFYNLFLEYASKGSLAELLRKSEGRFANSEVKRYTRGLLKGLCHVHQSGFVHSDVKLQNILVFDDGEAKLADFGLARKVEVSECRYQLRGTPLYMSPELIAGGKVATTEADIWAVGCAVVEMLTGKPVWDYSPENDVSGLFYRIAVCGESPLIPRRLCDEGKDFLIKCFLKDPNERWTARMLLDHPFICGFDDRNLFETTSGSPSCPFEFPDWESSEDSSFSLSSGLIDTHVSISLFGESDNSCWSSILNLFEGELVSNRVPDWSDSNEWVTIR